MSKKHFTALDAHCDFSEMFAVDSAGRLAKRSRLQTSIPKLASALRELGDNVTLTFEEGPLADWLARNLKPYVKELIVCEPRRNRLIAKSGDKDDPLDAERLAQLLRGGYLKPVHQTDSLERAIFKQHVGYYHDRVRDRVRQGHQVVALLRRHGVFTQIERLRDPGERKRLWSQLPTSRVLREDLAQMLSFYELMRQQEHETRRTLVRLARRHGPIRRFVEVPGIGWIRAATFYVYLDTPHRFATRSALWQYCGLGLERRHSGKGPMRVRLAHRGNRHLKNALLGAAKTVIGSLENPFAQRYHQWNLRGGMHPAEAKRNVARVLATLLWSLWRNDSRYDPVRVLNQGGSMAQK